jgi:hypothetical protein
MSSIPTTVADSFVLEPSLPNNGALSNATNSTIAAAGTGTITHQTLVANTIIVVGIAIDSAVTVTGISDTRFLVWSKLSAATIASSNLRAELWWAVEATARTHTITITLSAIADAALVAGSFSGVNAAIPIDPFSPSTATGTGTAASVNTPNANTSDVLIGFVASAASPTLTVGAGFTTVSSVAQSTNVSGGMEFQKLAAISPANTTNYTLGSSHLWVMLGACLMSTGNNVVLIQAAANQEFVLKNIYYSGPCLIAKWDGMNAIPIQSPTDGGVILYETIQVTAALNATAPSWVAIINPSATAAIDVGFDGIRSI